MTVSKSLHKYQVVGLNLAIQSKKKRLVAKANKATNLLANLIVVKLERFFKNFGKLLIKLSFFRR
jgi:hypothetical protein